MSRRSISSLVSSGAKFAWFQRQHHARISGCFSHLDLFKQQSFVTLFRLEHICQFSSHKISNKTNLELIVPDNENVQVDRKSFAVQSKSKRPLVVMLAWIAAKKNHLQKFSDLYLNSGYHVLVVPSTALQCVLPVNGSQMVAEDLLKFLAANPAYEKVVVHGFSVGGYLWGEVCLKIHKYPSVPGQLKAQVWDSLVDVAGAGEGVAAAVFPKNKLLRKFVHSVVQFYLWVFQNVATKYYKASSACFYDPPVKVPSIMFLSRSDTICSFKESLDVAESWRRSVKVTVKIWDDSPHVSHLRLHPEEYVNELNKYLQSRNMPLIHKS